MAAQRDVTCYGVDGPGIESRWGRHFPHLSRPALGPTQPPVQWVPGVSPGKERPGRDVDPSPLLVPWSRKSRAIPLLPLWAVRPVQSLSECTRGALYLTKGCLTSRSESTVHPKQAKKAQKGRKGIPLLYNLGARRGWVFNATDRPLYPR